MSLTRGSPSCESRRRDTASYSYNPCCALVVDLMCHSKNGLFNERAISFASSVLPVPGSPLISSGRDNTMAAFTAAINSSVAMYRSVPRNSPATLLAHHAQNLHGIRAAGDAAQFALGQNDGIAVSHQFQVEQLPENGEVKGLSFVGDIVGDRIHAAIQGHARARGLVAGECVNRNVRTHPRHPQRRRPRLGEGNDGLYMQGIRGVHHRGSDGLVRMLEIAAGPLPDAHMRDLILLRADDDLRHGLDDL